MRSKNENLEKNTFAWAGTISTIIFWYCIVADIGSDLSKGLVMAHAILCYWLAYLRKNGKYKNLKDIKLKLLELGTSGVKIEMQGKDDDMDLMEGAENDV